MYNLCFSQVEGAGAPPRAEVDIVGFTEDEVAMLSLLGRPGLSPLRALQLLVLPW